MLFQLDEEEIQSKQTKNNRILAGLHAYFFTQVSVYVALQIYCQISGDKFFLIYILAILDALMPAGLLLFAICCVKSQIMRLNQREIMAREVLIRVHGCIFTFIIMNYLAIDITGLTAKYLVSDQ